ncbi:hypothetical protein H8959_004354 [Pygathrix nigripes]
MKPQKMSNRTNRWELHTPHWQEQQQAGFEVSSLLQQLNWGECKPCNHTSKRHCLAVLLLPTIHLRLNGTVFFGRKMERLIS